MIDLSCIENVIGLTVKEPSCAPDKPDNWDECNKSISGYYIYPSEFVPIVPGNVLNDCYGNFWQLLKEARSAGLKDLIGHFLKAVGDKYTIRHGNLNATIGNCSGSYRNFTMLQENEVGIKVTPKRTNGTVFRIKRVGLAIDKVGDYIVNVTCLETGETETLGTISGGNNTQQWINTEYSYILNGNKSFCIWYETNGGLPLDYQFKSCSSCANSTPTYYDYMSVSGVQKNGTNVTNYSQYSYGLLLDVCLQCDYTSWMCGMEDFFWCGNPFGSLFAKLYQMYAALKFNQFLLADHKLGEHIAVKKEQILALNKGLMEDLNGLVYDLVDCLPKGASDCFVCASPYQARIQSLLVC